VCVDATNRPVIDEIERIGNYRWAFRVGTDEPEDAQLDPRRGRLLQGGICFVRKLQE
jgi:hypothetical protein